jgi:hypothetical protein
MHNKAMITSSLSSDLLNFFSVRFFEMVMHLFDASYCICMILFVPAWVRIVSAGVEFRINSEKAGVFLFQS